MSRARLQHLWREQRVFRFVAVGCFNTLLDIIILNILVDLIGLSVLVSNTMSVSVGITISYFLNHRIVFKEPENYSLKKFSHFFLVTGMSVLFVQNLVIYGFLHMHLVSSTANLRIFAFDIHALTLELNAAKLLAVLLAATWNFLLYKYVVFAHKPSHPPIEDETLIV